MGFQDAVTTQETAGTRIAEKNEDTSKDLTILRTYS